ncbi:phosphoribosyltransferase [Ignicoccus hospitalis]|uniref:Phosphoribosyltransferase n=1 Tax=Ignicoccus hospitalis (strain KIN4/I / DSM 18386 / JCM 14125) TaxID=453591 RepID=A8AAD4_IGNH4|nr:phosphoribosyltransferase [Ignicoccus hospitalis]ABU81886.1 phosphoribosyltransferase [Ignicoccus hospitalis KIN4/I]HIH89956.1 phosphoribosyltransferase [Desulfurococcaceae archaeon]
MVKLRVKVVTWEDVVRWTKELAFVILESGYKPDVIVAIARGGLTPARLLADYMDVIDILSLKVEHWVETGSHQEEAVIKYAAQGIDLSNAKVLIVDDICDTGKSLMVAKDYVEKYWKARQVKLATMQYIEPVAQIRPDYFVDLVRDWTWYMYPWNYVEDMVNLVKKILKEHAPLSLQEIIIKFQEWYNITPPIPLSETLRVMEYRGLVKKVDGKYELS